LANEASDNGIPYFAHDSDMRQDKKMKLVLAKFGLTGYSTYNFLLEEIYRVKGYYVKCDEDFMLVLASDLRIEMEELKKIIKFCVDRKLFDRKKYEEHKILTSKRTLNNYIEVTKRRKKPKFILDYIVCSEDELIKNHNNGLMIINNEDKIIYEQNNHKKVIKDEIKEECQHFDDKCEQHVDISKENVDIPQQTKTKTKSKTKSNSKQQQQENKNKLVVVPTQEIKQIKKILNDKITSSQAVELLHLANNNLDTVQEKAKVMNQYADNNVVKNVHRYMMAAITNDYKLNQDIKKSSSNRFHDFQTSNKNYTNDEILAQLGVD